MEEKENFGKADGEIKISMDSNSETKTSVGNSEENFDIGGVLASGLFIFKL